MPDEPEMVSFKPTGSELSQLLTYPSLNHSEWNMADIVVLRVTGHNFSPPLFWVRTSWWKSPPWKM